MNISRSVIVTAILIFGFTIFPISGTYAQDKFDDISDSKYNDSINSLYSRGIISWYGDGTYRPDQTITRAEMLKIVMWAWWKLNTTGLNLDCFDDVSSGDRHASYICTAKQFGIVWWYWDWHFKPDNPVTISEGIKMALGSFGIKVSEWSGSHWYQPYFDYVHDHDILSKYSVIQDDPMSRGMMAYVAYQLLDQKENWIKTRDSKSLWCSLDRPLSDPTSLIVDGVNRHFITAIWSNYNQNTLSKLIIAFHGRTNSNSQVRDYYGIEKASDQTAIIVYPLWLPEAGPSRSWSDRWDKGSDLRDFALFDAIVKEFTSKYCIDEDQIFVVGHSLWAWFTNTLACIRGDVIRAIGSVAGGTTYNKCTWPTAAILFHNPDDNLTPFSQGLKSLDQLLDQNSCDTATKPVWPPGGNCVEYTNCQEWAEVIRCPHSISSPWWYYYPHGWPKFVPGEIWKFFNR